jgi:hypothetical protein
MARGIHGLPKVSSGPAMPDPLHPAGGLRPSSTPLYTQATHIDFNILSFSPEFIQEACEDSEGDVFEEQVMKERYHGRVARGGHGLPKVSLGPAMPDPSMPYGWAARKADDLQPSSTLLDTGR